MSSAARRTTDAVRPRLRYLAAFGGAVMVAVVSVGVLLTQSNGFDAHVFWSAWSAGLYTRPAGLGVPDLYVYAPPLAQLLYPLTHLPWPLFWSMTVLVSGAAYVWLLRPVPLALRVPLLVACSSSIAMGNLEWALALVAVLGLRRPYLWALPLLTKITPGVGIVWFLARRQWRELGIALGATGIVVAASIAVSPDLWARFLAFMADNVRHHGSGYFFVGVLPPMPLVARTLVAVALVGWGARKDHPWVLAMAMVLTQPDASWNTLAILTAVPRLLGPSPVGTAPAQALARALERSTTTAAPSS